MPHTITIDDYQAQQAERHRHNTEPDRRPETLAAIRAYVHALHIGTTADTWPTLPHAYGTHCHDCHTQTERRRYGSLDLCQPCAHQRIRSHAHHSPSEK